MKNVKDVNVNIYQTKDGKNLIRSWICSGKKYEELLEKITGIDTYELEKLGCKSDWDASYCFLFIPSEYDNKKISGAYIESSYRSIVFDCELETLEFDDKYNGDLPNLKKIAFGPNFKISDDNFIKLVKTLEEKTYKNGFPKVFKCKPDSYFGFWFFEDDYLDLVPYLGNEWIGVTVQFDKRGNDRKKYKTLDKNIQPGTIVTADHGDYYAEGTVCEVKTKFNVEFYHRKPINTVIEYKKNDSIKELVDYISVEELSNDTIKIRKKGNSKKFKQLELPTFEGKKVIIAEGAFKGCTIGTLTFNCNVIKVEKDAFLNSSIKTIKNYKNVQFENIEDELLKFLVLHKAAKDYNPKSKKKYLNDDGLKIVYEFCDELYDRKEIEGVDQYDYYLSHTARDLGKNGLFNGFSYRFKTLILKSLSYDYCNNYRNKVMDAFIKNNYYNLLCEKKWEINTILLLKDIYQSWENLDCIQIQQLFDNKYFVDYFNNYNWTISKTICECSLEKINEKVVNDFDKVLKTYVCDKNKALNVYVNMLAFYYLIKYKYEWHNNELLNEIYWIDLDTFTKLLEYTIINNDPKISNLTNFEISEESAQKIINKISDMIHSNTTRIEKDLYSNEKGGEADFYANIITLLFSFSNKIIINNGESKEFISNKKRLNEEYNNMSELFKQWQNIK